MYKRQVNVVNALKLGLNKVVGGLERGAINMISVAIAIATAGIIVGAVSSTGLSNNLIVIVEAISGGNVITLLMLTAFLCIILGMGLPTTANYLVVAALMAQVVVEVGNASGYIFPLIAIHMYVFYYGLMADNGYAPLLMPKIDKEWDSPLGKEYGSFVRWALPMDYGETFGNLSIARSIDDPSVIVPVLDDGEGSFDDTTYGRDFNQIIQLFFEEELLLLNADWENTKFETTGEKIILPTFEQGERPLGEYHPLYLHYVEAGLVLYGINPQPLFLGIDYDSKSVESMNPVLDDTCINGTPTEPAKSWYECIKYDQPNICIHFQDCLHLPDYIL